jgi:hypothetical protein
LKRGQRFGFDLDNGCSLVKRPWGNETVEKRTLWETKENWNTNGEQLTCRPQRRSKRIAAATAAADTNGRIQNDGDGISARNETEAAIQKAQGQPEPV